MAAQHSTRVLRCLTAGLHVQPSLCATGAAGGKGGDQAIPNVALASRWAPYKAQKLLYSTGVTPIWIDTNGGAELFWYTWKSSSGTDYYIVDCGAGTKTPIFDNDELAALLTTIVEDPYDGLHLPIEKPKFVDADTFTFDVTSSQDDESEGDGEDKKSKKSKKSKKVFHFAWTVSAQTLVELRGDEYSPPESHPSWASISPDGEWVVYARYHNLWLMRGEDYQRIVAARETAKTTKEAQKAEDELDEKEGMEEIQLTTDGEEHYSYGMESSRGETNKTIEEALKKRKPTGAIWSPDSSRFALVRHDEREVGDLWVVHAVGNERPELESYKYDMPGEDHVMQSELFLYDIPSMTGIVVHEPEGESWVDQGISIPPTRTFKYAADDTLHPRVWMAPSSDLLYYIRTDRFAQLALDVVLAFAIKQSVKPSSPVSGRHRVSLMAADLSSLGDKAGNVSVRTVIANRSNTYIDRGYDMGSGKCGLVGDDIIWWSEEDGWGHLYRYSPQGELVARLTKGPWHVDGFIGYDASQSAVFLTGCGREADEDPYYKHVYSVSLSDGEVTLLDPGDTDHEGVSLCESGAYFVETSTRVDAVPVSTLRNAATGIAVMQLEESDISQLLGAGWHFPEPFTAKADDGVTDIYGVMYKPFDFDPAKSYPIVAYVYPGPQTEAVNKNFGANMTEQGLAQFGFIVVTLGNRGGHPDRSKYYHNYGYGNLRDYGLADKKAILEQLGDRHSFIDLDRIGIYGHSGGGFMSTAAMLVYPDFFKVAVSSSGNHDNDVYNRSWSETHDGVKEIEDEDGATVFEFDIDRNSELAENLKGHLMLTTGDVDNNVHHAGTFRMAHALMEARKRFDLFVFPGERHGYIGEMANYWFWLRAEYFAKHLIGEPEWSADMLALQGNFPKRTPAGGGSRRKTKPGSNARVTMDGHLIKDDDQDDDDE